MYDPNNYQFYIHVSTAHVDYFYDVQQTLFVGCNVAIGGAVVNKKGYTTISIVEPSPPSIKYIKSTIQDPGSTDWSLNLPSYVSSNSVDCPIIKRTVSIYS